jgi:hypothetical protein
MIFDLTNAMACAERALALAKDLDTVRGPGDLRQVSAGVRHELDCVIQSLSDVLDGLTEAAVGDRPGQVRSDADATSRAAATAIVVKSGSQRGEILKALAKGDRTDFELQVELGIDQNSERPRRGELVRSGFVQATEQTRRHRDAEFRVWAITDLGYEVVTRLYGEQEAPPPKPSPTLF